MTAVIYKDSVFYLLKGISTCSAEWTYEILWKLFTFILITTKSANPLHIVLLNLYSLNAYY